MGLFNFFTRKPARPYREELLNSTYELLFCDHPALFALSDAAGYPWEPLAANALSTEELTAITDDITLDTRAHILAHNRLTERGVRGEKILLGVVVEAHLKRGLDVLAAYNDGTARYLNHSGKVIVWESPTDESDELIRDLFAASVPVVSRIGPWEEARRPFPAKNMARVTFLVSDGLYFGEGPFEVLQQEPMAGPVIAAATALMTHLVEQEEAAVVQ